MSKQGLSKTFTFHVALDEASEKMTVTDDSREVEWQAGAGGVSIPVASASAQRMMGRVYEVSARKDFGWGADGSFGPQVDYTFSSSEGRGLIKKVAEELGWSERMPTTMRIGLYVGIGAIVMALPMGVIALVLVLTR